MSSNIDSTPPDNGGTGLPGKNVDEGREEIAERVQRKLDDPRRIPPDPLKESSR
jgi:hypothetical protein